MTFYNPNVPFGAGVPEPEPVENVAFGLMAALAAVLGGVVVTVILWRIGFIAALSSLVIAAGAIALYSKAAGCAPKRGLVPLVVLILLGVVASFFAIIASDLWDAYDVFVKAQYSESRLTFISDNIFNSMVLSHYTKDIAMFAIFAVLGIFGSLRRVVGAHAMSRPRAV